MPGDAAAASGLNPAELRSRAFHVELRRLLPYVRPYRKLAFGSVSIIGLGSIVSLITPWPLAILLDTVLGDKPLPALLGFLGGVGRNPLIVFAVCFELFVALASHGLSILENYVNTRLSQRIVLDFRSDLFRHVQRLSPAFHDSSSTGLLMFRMSNEADAAGSIVVAIPPLLQAVVTLVLMFLVAFRLDSELALIALGVVPFVYYSAGYYTKRIQPRVYEVRNLEGQVLSILHEGVSMLRVIVPFGRERHEFRRFRTQGEAAVDARVRLTLRQTLFGLAVGMITSAGTAAVLGIGAVHVLDHRLSPGELVVMLGYVAAMYQPLEQISNALSTLQQEFIAVRWAFNLLDTEPEVVERPDAVAVRRVLGRVSFRDVSFHYPGRPNALERISFDVEAGQRVAIVGPTGAGKTTLASLIPRLFDPQAGRVEVDGRDIRDLTLASLRHQVGMVMQEPLLFSGSIASNIRYGRLEATADEVEEAARAANAHDFISRLPDGYDTMLGERGAKLSGGERQRLCIARAFVKDAPILILDEPTASIDSRTEAVILDALERLMDGRTTFMIAHRLSTIRNADLILVLDHGRLVERGTHDELVAAGGLYAQLHDFQAGEEQRRRAVEASESEAAERLLETLARRTAAEESRASHEFAEALRRRLAARKNGSDGAGADEDGRTQAVWLLLGAVLPLIEHGFDGPLRALAARETDTDPETRHAAALAAGLIGELRPAEAAH